MTPPPIPLTEPQARRITSVLAGLDEGLAEIDLWLSGLRPSGLLYRAELDLDPERQTAIRLEVERARQALRQVIEALRLQTRVSVASRAIGVSMLVSLIDLDELDPENLKGYGRISEEMVAPLRAYWDALRGPVKRIRACCVSPSPGGRK